MTFLRTSFSLAAAFSMTLLNSCESLSPMTLGTEDEINTMRQAQLTHAVGGAVVGAGIGAGIAALSGADKDDIWKGAGFGALAGGLAGTAHGTQRGGQVVQQKRTAIADEAFLNKSIANAKRYNSALQSYNSKLERKIAGLRSNYDAQTASAAKRQASKLVKEVDKEIGTRQKFLAEPANASRKSQMTSEKNELTAKRNKLAKLVNTLEGLEATNKG